MRGKILRIDSSKTLDKKNKQDAKHTIPEISSLLASFTMRLTASESQKECILELEKVSENFFDVEWYSYISKEGDSVGKKLDQQTRAFAEWTAKKRRLSISPSGNSLILFVPLFSRTRNLGVLLMGIKNRMEEIRLGIMDIESFLAFETSMVIENMRLTTELIKKNEYVAEAKFYLENVLNSLKYAVVVEDVYKNEEFSNEPYRRLLERNAGIKGQIEEFVKSSFVYRKEISQEIDVGGSFYSVHVVPVKLSSGLKVITSIQDITNTKELERLQKIDRMKNDFVASVSHELKTPLSAILAYSETIIDSIDSMDPSMVKQFMETIKSEGEHLSSIIEDMINFSKMESDRLSMTFERIDLLKILRESYEGFKIKTKEKGFEFSLNVKDGIASAFVTADPKRVRQVIDNLISNALKYDSSPYPEIKLSIRSTDDGYLVTVYDNGDPIPPDERKKVFDKFYRLETIKSKVSGTGLGLAISKQIVEMHRGEIWIEGENECIFNFSLPKKDWLQE